jgi:hypothetical protein
MRSRVLKPDFFTNEELQQCEPLARILYAGLWCFADRKGCFEWRPLKMKAQIFPLDSCVIEPLLDQLVNMGLVCQYDVNGKTYGIIPTFLKHQSPHHRESDSEIPLPNDEINRSMKTQVVKLVNININKNRSRSTNRSIKYTDEFLEFWKVYPEKVGKGKAFESWNRIGPPRPSVDEIKQSVERQKKSRKWKEGFVPLPATWLNQRRWEDEPMESGGDEFGI